MYGEECDSPALFVTRLLLSGDVQKGMSHGEE